MKDRVIEQMKLLLEAWKLHEKRSEQLKKFSKDRPRKLTKQYYLDLKKLVFDCVEGIQKEISIWNNIKEEVKNNDESGFTEEMRHALEEMHCTRYDVLANTDEIIENLENEIDGMFDIINRTNDTVREVQSELRKLPPIILNLIPYNPNCNFDLSILEIETETGVTS